MIFFTHGSNNLDSLTVKAVNDWLELPNGSCTAEFLQLPAKQEGYDIPSMKMTAQKLRLGIRFMLKHNRDDELRNIGQATSTKNIPLDSLISEQQTKSAAMTSLESQHLEAATNHVSSLKQHVSSLKIQGKSFNSIRETFVEATINSWSTMINNLLPSMLFSFVRKALQQQLPTASVVFVDLNELAYKPLSELFISLRPDIAIKYQNRMSTLELTICHETNMKASKQFKSSKYNNLNQNLLPEFSRCKLLSNTVEVSSLGHHFRHFGVFESQFNRKNA